MSLPLTYDAVMGVQKAHLVNMADSHTCRQVRKVGENLVMLSTFGVMGVCPSALVVSVVDS